MIIQSEEEFSEIPRLRVKKDEDGCWIAKTAHKKLKGNHLYFHGPGKLGIYYQADTRMATTYRRMWWEGLVKGLVLEDLCQPGEYDGIIIFKPKRIGDIPKFFFKGQPRGQPFENFNFKPLSGWERELKSI